MITSWQFYAGILGIGVLYLFGGYQAKFITDVYISYFYNGWFSTAIMVGHNGVHSFSLELYA